MAKKNGNGNEVIEPDVIRETALPQVIAESENLPASRSGDPLALMQYAMDKGAGVDVIERMMAVRREIRAEQAQEAFDAAMEALQGECPTIERSKTASNRDGRAMYKFAPLDSIITQVKPLMRKHGFSHGFTTEVTDGWVRVICTIRHTAGHSRQSEFKVPTVSGSPMMSEPQKYASALTFAKRYAFLDGFGIVTGDEDNDAAEPSIPAGPSSKAAAAPEKSVDARRKELWDATRLVHKVPEGKKSTAEDREGLSMWLRETKIIREDQGMLDLTAPELVAAIEKVKEELA